MVSTLFLLGSLFAFEPEVIIRGEEVKPHEYREVLYLSVGGSTCSSVLVGRRTILTAGHCAPDKTNARVQHAGRAISVSFVRSPRWNEIYREHDLAVGYLSESIEDARPISVVKGDLPPQGTEISVVGYGCDGRSNSKKPILRKGKAPITSMSYFEFTSGTEAASVGCYGDSGGAAIYEKTGERRLLLGIHARSNLRSTTWHTRLDSRESQDLFKTYTQLTHGDICGFNIDCE